MQSENVRCAKLMREARQRHNVSQMFIADSLNITRKTVQNWENGATAPTVPQVIAWFTLLGESPMPAFLSYMYPDTTFTAKDSFSASDCFYNNFRHLTSEAIDMLGYICKGKHGSSPHALLNLITAYCHLPLRCKIQTSGSIVDQYRIALEYGDLNTLNCILPNIDCIRQARTNAINILKTSRSLDI